MSVETPEKSYPVTPRNRVKRLHERGAYDREAVHAVLDSALLCHVAYVIDGQPFCTPTMHWREGDWLYWHGSSASRMLRHLKAGTPVCLTVSHLDGLVLARSGFHHSANYRSVMCFGKARVVDDPEEKRKALKGVVERFYPGRTAQLRPDQPQEVKATMVIGMPIAEASVKLRAAQVGDDEEDFALPVWAGVIPVTTVIGKPETSPHVPSGVSIPEHLALYDEGRPLDDVLIEAQALYERHGG
ncbi:MULTISPECIES: pyridoxamine 5'-phosphate oxidase family protein [Alphaproteobacteria]|uniref:Flavin-nucleotide-binding protein n=2 Tax=Alphaproteobacteria TaxID=28211 RepID=A0A512HD76_9HYPH|nr:MULTISPECIES: pyridoxamine 5'-phosphate oxidase family protein [Alphaproteobacteria]GEO83404.1 flavin-nucleotide-binding protein [Ciceribacter naphthalenivorans]GLR23023.1 flavin-nucleotide-binding protein [Ciceribacter naphthalenivorans]GLT05879.1 flavin-nucleotide-binding protein [Sphingomonas psychrolutea]